MKGIGIGVLVVVLLIGGYFFWSNQDAPKEAPVVTTEAERTERTPAGVTEEKTVIGSIKEAMGFGTALRCTYAVGEGDQAVQAEVYVNGQSFKTTSTVNGVEMQALSDGKTQYMWMSGNKQGMKFDMACLEKLQGMVPEKGSTPPSMNPEDYQKSFDMAKNVSCEPALAVDFSVPPTVEFVDQCALMEQMTQMMPKGYMAE